MKIAPIVFAALISSLLISIPATAQECPSEREGNNSIAVADYVTSVPGSGCRQGSIDPADDWDYYSFDVDSPVSVTILTETQGDTVITLLDRGGSVIQENDDSEGSRSSRIDVYLLAGRYYVAVRSYGNASVIRSYILRIETPEPEGLESEDNGTIQTADEIGAIPGIASIRGSAGNGMDPQDDVDIFSVIVEAAGDSAPLVFTAILLADQQTAYDASAFTSVTLLDSDGARVEDFTWFEIEGAWSTYVPKPVPPGKYFLELRWPYATAPVGDYFVVVSSSFAEELSMPMHDSVWRSIEHDNTGALVGGSIHASGEMDRYTFTLSSRSRVTFTTFTGGDTIIALYGDSEMYEMLGMNDDISGDDRRSELQLSEVLDPEKAYYLTVKAYGGATIDRYILSLTIEPEP